MSRSPDVAEATDPDGRSVVMTEEGWLHIRSEHREMEPALGQIMRTIEDPDHLECDEKPGNERYFRRGFGPSRWLRVVVAFDDQGRGEVVTAFGQRDDP